MSVVCRSPGASSKSEEKIEIRLRRVFGKRFKFGDYSFRSFCRLKDMRPRRSGTSRSWVSLPDFVRDALSKVGLDTHTETWKLVQESFWGSCSCCTVV